MKLEEEIKMTSINDPKLKAVLEIIFTSAYINNRHTKYLKPFNISPQQYNILRILRGSHPTQLTVMDIKSRMLDKTPNTTRLVDKLILNQYVTRNRCDNDRRKIFVGITELGLTIMQKLDKINEEFLSFTNNINNKEAEHLSLLIEKLRN